MAAANKGQEEKITALYARLSDDDPENEKKGVGEDKESNSILNQRTILYDYARSKGYLHPTFFFDDGVSGTTFDRPGFKEMEELIEAGKVSTVIVKDLSRFGRNYLEVGNYLEVVYPTLGVKFIAIQENVDTLSGTGTEMMPFHNIFNEWFAGQTSKKIKQVWSMKASNGKRVGTTVPYGYRRDPDDHEKWLIDEPAAAVVRRIFSLFMEGNGPNKIARILQADEVPTPTAYFYDNGIPTRNDPPQNPYYWHSSTVSKILDNRQYTGCTVNFKTTNVSFKVHKKVYREEDEWQIIPNTQDAIIDENTWLRVHELRANKRRPTALGKRSLFSGLVFCPDCGAKLHFCASRSLKPNQEFFRCANYKDGRGKCTIHYIRNVVLEQLVLEAIHSLADFVRCYESSFLFLAARRNNSLQRNAVSEAEQTLVKSRKRATEIDRIIARLYEDNILGKLSDERFMKLSDGYEQEQAELTKLIAEQEEVLKTAEKATVDLRMLLKGLRDFMEINALTPEIVNTLIKRIEVHNSDRSSGHVRVKVDIYFTAIGMFDMPTAQELEELAMDIKNNREKYGLSA